MASMGSPIPAEVREITGALLAHLRHADPGGVVGAYLYGSAVTSGLRPSSDIDVLLVVQRSFTHRERRDLCDLLLRLSGWSGHADTFPDAVGRRPVELTVMLEDNLAHGGRHLRRVDFQYGEWLRAGIVAGETPAPAEDSDAVVLLATAQDANLVLRGPPLGELVDPVSRRLLGDSVTESVPALVQGIGGDERNVLLTLARILVTLDTGSIVPKDDAASLVGRAEPDAAAVLEQARRDYRGGGSAADALDPGEARRVAGLLATRISAKRGLSRG